MTITTTNLTHLLRLINVSQLVRFFCSAHESLVPSSDPLPQVHGVHSAHQQYETAAQPPVHFLLRFDIVLEIEIFVGVVQPYLFECECMCAVDEWPKISAYKNKDDIVTPPSITILIINVSVSDTFNNKCSKGHRYLNTERPPHPY